MTALTYKHLFTAEKNTLLLTVTPISQQTLNMHKHREATRII